MNGTPSWKYFAKYLGRLISKEIKTIAPNQIEAIIKAPKPQTVKQMMTFSGMTGYSSDWIGEYAEIVTPLRKIMKEAGQTSLKNVLQWNDEAKMAFNTIKQELQSALALALALPNYENNFHLYVSNRQEGYAAAVLTQETGVGKGKQPVIYYSTKLDEVAQGYPPCYQGLAAVHYACESVTMGYPVIIPTTKWQSCWKKESLYLHQLSGATDIFRYHHTKKYK